MVNGIIRQPTDWLTVENDPAHTTSVLFTKESSAHDDVCYHFTKISDLQMYKINLVLLIIINK